MFFSTPELIIFPKIGKGELRRVSFPKRIFAIVSGTGYITKYKAERKNPIMKIIDAHFHFSKCVHFDELAQEAGHENCAAHLAEVYRQTGIVLGIAMGEMGGERIGGVCTPRMPAMPQPYPPFIAWCAGLDSDEIASGTLKRSLELFAAAFSRPDCVGLKLYPGYHTIPLNDPAHDP